MSADATTRTTTSTVEQGDDRPAARPERVSHALARDVTLPGGAGTLVLVTIDNGLDHTKPTTLGPQGMAELVATLTTVRDRVGDGEANRQARPRTALFEDRRRRGPERLQPEHNREKGLLHARQVQEAQEREPQRQCREGVPLSEHECRFTCIHQMPRFSSSGADVWIASGSPAASHRAATIATSGTSG